MTRAIIPADREPEIPSNRLAFFFREALRRIWVSKRTSFVAIAMIAMSLFTLGSFLVVSENLGRTIRQWQGRSHVNIYVEAAATPEQIHAVDLFLASHPDLSRRHYVTREEAVLRFRGYFSNLSDVVAQLEENPFPPSFEVEVTPQIVQTRVFDEEISQLRTISGVDQVQFDWEWLSRLKRLVNFINVIGFVAGGILGIAAAFTIANVIRLTMMLYREEIEIMRLVGATERIIRGPFMIEGLLQGTIGGIVAVLLLFGAFELTRRILAPPSSLLWGFLFVDFLPWPKIAGLVIGGMIAGSFGSWLSVRDTSYEKP